jgi:hypothetical protein
LEYLGDRERRRQLRVVTRLMCEPPPSVVDLVGEFTLHMEGADADD